MSEEPRFKKMDIAEPVSITLPAYAWVGFFSAYVSTEWTNYYANLISEAAQKEMLDPLYIKEREAAIQEQLDQGHAHLQQFITGQPPQTQDPRLDVKPEDPQDD